MKNSNIIISITIVLCIAAGVTAYGLTNPKDNIFESLSSAPLDDEATDTVDDDGSGSGNSGSGSGNSGSGSGNSGSGSGNSGSGSGNSGTGSGISSSEAKNIVNSKYIGEPNHYAGTPTKLDDGNWIVPILDPQGNQVDGIIIDAKTGENLGRG